MVVLSPHELADCVLKAGFSAVEPGGGADYSPARIMLAICMVESAAMSNKGIRTDVLARSTTGASVGNWDHGVGQISGRWHGDLLRETGGQWRNPYVNLRLCKRIYAARVAAGLDGFAAWNTYVAGTHVTYLPDAAIALADPWPCPELEWMPHV